MSRALVLISLGVLCLAGCKSYITYAPNPSAVPTDEAALVKLVKETIEQQVYSVTELEVTKDHFKMITEHRGSFWYGAGAGRSAVSVYYKNIGKNLLFQRKQYYYVQLFDKAGVLTCTIALTDLEMAKRFIDALYALKAKAAGT